MPLLSLIFMTLNLMLTITGNQGTVILDRDTSTGNKILTKRRVQNTCLWIRTTDLHTIISHKPSMNLSTTHIFKKERLMLKPSDQFMLKVKLLCEPLERKKL